MIVAKGIPPGQTETTARLYWEAFGQKLHLILGPDDRAIAFIMAHIDPSHVITARDPTGQVIGLAGFKTPTSAFVTGSLRDLAAHYGWAGALWRAAILRLLERDVENTNFLADGIAVGANARGQGVGTALLDALSAEARRRNYPAVRLDVIDTNPRAQALYTRAGFTPVKTTSIGPLRHIFGFRHSVTMIRPV